MIPAKLAGFNHPEPAMENSMHYDVFAICSALMDVQARVEAEHLTRLGLTPGAMHLIEADERTRLLSEVEPLIVNTAAGGSGANTAMGVAALGGTACFAGRVGRDRFGSEYTQSLGLAGVQPSLSIGDGPTGLCIVLITPDGQRTMCTYLGESRLLAPENLPLPELRRAHTLYATGYLWDSPVQKETVRLAMATANEAAIPISLSLADTFCIERHRDEFRCLVNDEVDILFANEAEALLLVDAEDVLQAAERLASMRPLCFITLGDKGALVAHRNVVQHIETTAVNPVDTTGAGDAFAAGVLYGLNRNRTPIEAAALGNRLAAHVVSRLGPRPDTGFAASLTASHHPQG